MPENEHFSTSRHKRSFLILTSFIAGLFLSFLTEGLHAAETEPLADITQSESLASPDDIEGVPGVDVTVIGSRLPSLRIPFASVPSNVSYIPANVTTKDREAVQFNRPKTFQESVQDIEGAVFYDSVGNGLDTTFSLRGFNTSNAVVFLVDGVRVNELDGNDVVFPLLDMSDVESIQIDRGSASHIYGNGAFAGVVHITTGQASEKPLSLFGGLEVSSHQGLRFNQGMSGTLQDKVTSLGGKWTYYFNGGRNVSDGFKPNGESRITSFDFKTSYELPDDQGKIHVGVKHTDDAISNPGEMTMAQYQADEGITNKPLDGRKYKNTIIQMGADKKFWDNRIMASVFSSWRNNQANFFSTSGAFTGCDEVLAFGFLCNGNVRNPDTDFVTVKSRSTDLIWQLSYSDEWTDWLANQTLVGSEYRNGSDFSKEVDAFGGQIEVDPLVETERDSDLESFGIFWRETLRIFDRVIAHFGMRHDWHWLKSKDVVTPTDSVERDWSDTSLSAGITFQATDHIDLFGNYSQGFRIPTVSEIAPFSGTVSAGLDAEKSDSFEIGTRVRLKDKGLLKFSWFLIDVSDEIAFDSTAISVQAPFGQNVNLGESRRTGLEVRLDLNPIQEVDLYGSYTWTQAWNRTTNPAGTLADDRALGQIPEQRATFGIVVRPLERLGENFKGLRVGLNGTYTGKQHPTAYETTSQVLLNAVGDDAHWIKSYTLWNFLAAYTWRDFEVYFKINNIFDNKYYSRSVTASSFGTAIYPADNYSFVTPGAPREYMGGIRWKFDSILA